MKRTRYEDGESSVDIKPVMFDRDDSVDIKPEVYERCATLDSYQGTGMCVVCRHRKLVYDISLYYMVSFMILDQLPSTETHAVDGERCICAHDTR